MYAARVDGKRAAVSGDRRGRQESQGRRPEPPHDRRRGGNADAATRVDELATVRGNPESALHRRPGAHSIRGPCAAPGGEVDLGDALTADLRQVGERAVRAHDDRHCRHASGDGDVALVRAQRDRVVGRDRRCGSAGADRAVRDDQAGSVWADRDGVGLAAPVEAARIDHAAGGEIDRHQARRLRVRDDVQARRFLRRRWCDDGIDRGSVGLAEHDVGALSGRTRWVDCGDTDREAAADRPRAVVGRLRGRAAHSNDAGPRVAEVKASD